MVDCKMVCAYCTYGQKSTGTGGLTCYNRDSEHFMQPVHYAGYCLYYVREIDKTEHELKEALEVLSSYCSKYYHPPTDNGERGCDKDCLFLNKGYGTCLFAQDIRCPGSSMAYKNYEYAKAWCENNVDVECKIFFGWRKSQEG